MGDTSLRTFLIGISLMLIAITIGHYFLFNVETLQEITPSPELQEIYQNFSGYLVNNTDQNDNIQAELVSTGDKLDDAGGEASVIKNVYTVLKLPFEQQKVVQSTTSRLSILLGIPREIYYSFLALVGIVIFCIVLSLILRVGKA